MSLTPLLNAQPIIQLHAGAAVAALLVGGMQILARKGTAAHRWLGYAWVALMATVAIGSFGIHETNQWHGYSLIHLLSVYVLISLVLAIRAAWRHDILTHKRTMQSMYFFGLIVAGAFTFVPGRIMHSVLFGN